MKGCARSVLPAGIPRVWRTTSIASSRPSARKPFITVEISLSLAAISVSRSVPITIHSTLPINPPVSARNTSANNAANRNDSALKSLVGGKQPIPGSAHGLNGVAVCVRIESGAQAADMTLDHAGIGIEVDVPDILEQHFPGDRPVDIAQQVLEQ